MTETELQEKIYTELVSIHRRLDRLERLLIPREKLTTEEMRELDELEADADDAIPWENTTPEEEEALNAEKKTYLTEEKTLKLLE
ncbi:TPA: hypothetical protein HA344_04945 [Candidatus Bathyarchaeota archaeon]|nr:hypothetical protein [Candidatus Bathyarchaeota archaeon]